MKINVVTPWKILCGNAAYTKGLVKEQEKKVRIKIVEIKKPYTKNPLYFIALARQAGKDCTLIHVHHGYGVFGKFLLSGIFTPLFYLFTDKNKKIVTTLHDVYELPGFLGLGRKVLNYFMFKYSDVLHVHSPKAAQLLIKNGVEKEKVFLSPLAIFQKPIFLNKNICKKKLNLEGKKVLLLFGFIQKNKGHDRIIKILPHLKKDVCLLIAGYPSDKGYYKELKSLAKKLGVENRVVFKGEFKNREIPRIMGSTDLGLLPYRAITQSSIFGFFIAYHIPVISSSLPFFQSVKEEYKCVETAKNEKEYVKKIENLLSNKRFRKRTIQNMKRYLNDRKVEKIASDMKNMYLSLVEEE